MSEEKRREIPPEPPPERRERLRLRHLRTRGGRIAKPADRGSTAPGVPEHEFGRLRYQLGPDRKPFKPYTWRDPARWQDPGEDSEPQADPAANEQPSVAEWLASIASDDLAGEDSGAYPEGS
jgi:hypothetical protein